MTALESSLLLQLRAAGLEPEREYHAIPGRKFRWDFAFVAQRLLVEVQGSTWVAGTGHTSGRGIARDCEKVNLATLHGWRVLLFTRDMVEDGSAVATIIKALRGEG